MRKAVAPFFKHEPIRMLEGRYPTPPYPELRTWQDKAWESMPAILDEHETNEVRIIDDVAWGPVDVDLDEFERCIQYARDAYERAMGVRPTVIDLPNWTRGTILEQIAFTNGFTIADRRTDED